jgi:hypothetical protein
MPDHSNEIKWHPRVPQRKLIRLYESDASNLLNTELLNDIAITLYLRCESIIMVGDAQKGKIHCPRCHNNGRSTIISRLQYHDDYQLICPTCKWSTTWEKYLKSYQRKQLSIGGAGPYFREYMESYRKAKTPSEKMLAVDRVIHQFHYNLLRGEIKPTRANCVNLIEGSLTQTVQLLNDLHTSTRGTKIKWHSTLNSIKEHPTPRDVE